MRKLRRSMIPRFPKFFNAPSTSGFLLTGGRDPLFNPLDANTPTPADKTWAQRYQSYSMLRKGLFRRGGDLPATAEFEIIAVDDPLKAGFRL